MNTEAVDLSHTLLHLQDVSHHHHADGTVHYDDSEESIQHATETAGTTLLSAILPAQLVGLAATSRSVAPPFTLLLIPDGITTVLIRPPTPAG